MKTFLILLCCLAFILLPLTGLCIKPPQHFGNHLRLNTGEYLYAEDNPSLDFELRGNFAVEFWFKLESMPELPFQQRVLLAKPGSYSIVVFRETGVFNNKGLLLPRNSPSVYVVATAGEKGWATYRAVFDIEPNKWHHIAFETWRKGNVRHAASYYNGEKGHGPENIRAEMWCADTDSRFYIGDVPRETIKSLTEIDLPYTPFVSTPIYLDEVRLSVAPVGRPKLNVRLEPNPETMALWHFGEGPDAPKYVDSAGDNTFFRQSLSVSPNRALTTTWGRLKSLGL